ncbi:trypsin-like serine protease [Streptomyces sp. NPDC006692]|uniref:trypsin-like serine protease n=1 Tax=Streptomyces sp. NPDC006692 TaxID=3364758 RepID=UPI0036A19D53
MTSYDGYNTVTDRMLCAGPTAGGAGFCTGDAGGPLLQNGVLTGLVSWADGCVKPNYPGVYTDVSTLTGWITQQTGIGPDTPPPAR